MHRLPNIRSLGEHGQCQEAHDGRAMCEDVGRGGRYVVYVGYDCVGCIRDATGGTAQVTRPQGIGLHNYTDRDDSGLFHVDGGYIREASGI